MVPAAASSTVGEFVYRYGDEQGIIQEASLEDPPSGRCVNLPEVAEVEDGYAMLPSNYTFSTATVFKRANCDGNAYYSIRPGGHASDRLLMKSVFFS
jgi:hypothetical protein